MNKNFIKEIEIKNFKCFEDFKANGFKRVNLIGGKNNVGKTALMEACYINLNGDEDNYIKAILQIIRQRDNFFVQNNLTSVYKVLKMTFFYQTTLSKQYQKNLIHAINSNVNQTHFTFQEKLASTTIGYRINNHDFSKSIEVNHFKELIMNDGNAPYLNINNQIKSIRTMGLSDDAIVEYYSALQRIDKESFLDRELKKFDDNIIHFKIINNSPEVNTKSSGYISLSQFGEGIKHFINIIISIYVSENGCLFIDEIENGIHYTQLDRLWEIILTLSEALNCQVFVTTHSKDCIESYYKVSKKIAAKDIAYVILTQLKSGKIHAGLYDYELLENGIEQEHEVR
ncbi:AAA family ATPase [Candidatus Marithioploca araucensis]|uniref:AAA family ATPase n=1 Tax=Candidatus Marithioploca araucensis TaxID=70273 RepID=A0ABT7VQ06_9GAMM|nr:AAA family ATPase [Candidatus Marithioploca araucensis]